MSADHTSEHPTEPTQRDPSSGSAAVESAIIALSRFWGDSRLYPGEHPLLEGQLTETEQALTTALDGCGELTIKTIGGDLVCGDQKLFGGTEAPGGFIAALAEKGLGFITFERGVTASELRSLCEVLSMDAEELEPAGGAEETLSAAGVRHLQVGQLGVLGAGGSRVGSSRLSLLELYQGALDVAREALESVREGRSPDVRKAASIINKLVTRVADDPVAAVGLACLRAPDDHVFSHCIHTTMLATAFGEAIGLEVAELRELGLAAVLHDVGKGLTPLEILRKPDELTDGEREVVERHPVDGAAILLACPDLPAVAPVVAFEHHLHYDLTGYPQVPDKRELSLFSMVVSLAHTFDALTTHRPGRPAMRPDEARAAMGSMPEGRFEPRLADWFRQMLGTYPPGMCVELDTGECAVVRRSDPSSERRPVVCVVMDADGGPVSSPYEVELPDRQTDGTGCPGSIARPIAPDERGIRPSYLLDAWIQLYCSAQ